MIIAVGKGHNVFNNKIFDPGAVSYPYVEADETNKAVDELIILLRKKGNTVVDITPKNQHFLNSKAAHEERARRVNEGNFDIYLDVHLNSGGGTGPEMWVYKANGEAYDYARKIVNEIASVTGLRNRGVKVKSTMWSLSMTNCPSIIIEGGFIDSKEDMEKLDSMTYARAIASAFDEVKEDISGTLYRVRKNWEDPKSQNGAYIDLNNAIDQVKKLNDGYKVFDEKGNQVYPEKEKTHWGKTHVDNLNKKGIEITEERFDDNMTRAEVFALVDKATDKELPTNG